MFSVLYKFLKLVQQRDVRTYCKSHRDKVLRSGLSRLLNQQQEGQENRSEISSHTNYRYLTTPEKIQRMYSLRNAVRLSKRKISDLQCRLDRLIKVDGIKLDDQTHDGLLSIMKRNQNISTSSETFSDIFWQQQLKAASVKGKSGMRWHPAMIR